MFIRAIRGLEIMSNKLIAEFIGTYFLYLIIGLCVTQPGADSLTPLAVGVGLAALIYAFGHISKAHFNPATTATFFYAGTHPKKDVLPYLAAILIGAIFAAFTLSFLAAENLRFIQAIEIDIPRTLLAEFAFTFILMWVILNVAAAKGTSGNEFYGLAIGFIVAAGAYAVGPISFAAFNPAVTFALCINGFIPWSALILYVTVQLAAAVAAGLLFRRMDLTA